MTGYLGQTPLLVSAVGGMLQVCLTPKPGLFTTLLSCFVPRVQSLSASLDSSFEPHLGSFIVLTCNNLGLLILFLYCLLPYSYCLSF